MKDKTLQLGHAQAEMLTEIGAYLRYLRQDKALSIEDLAAKTLIPTRILRAIEEGDMHGLPEPVYVQGFIRRYADAIGMNGVEIANGFPMELGARYQKPDWRGRVEAQLRPLHLYLIYMLLVVGAVSGLSFLMERSLSPSASRYARASQAALPSVSSEQYGPPLPSQMGISASPQAAQTSNKPIRVAMTLTDQSWLRIVVDGKDIFEGVLPQGTQRNLEADKQITIRAGNAGGVLLSHNEEKAKPMGEPGSVDEVTFGDNVQADTSHESAAEIASSGRSLF
jgi:cytoskeletal protein RodZ